jgi:hypothetical protein
VQREATGDPDRARCQPQHPSKGGDRDGLGLGPFTVDVHAAQWGTLSRLIAAVDSGAVEHGVAIDENTAVIVDGNEATVAGLGRVYSVRADGQAMLLRSYRSGDRFSVASGRAMMDTCSMRPSLHQALMPQAALLH